MKLKLISYVAAKLSLTFLVVVYKDDGNTESDRVITEGAVVTVKERISLYQLL